MPGSYFILYLIKDQYCINQYSKLTHIFFNAFTDIIIVFTDVLLLYMPLLYRNPNIGSSLDEN